ncbi:MAG: hypothetical protein KIPDCIKN_00242 [Haliscomenobacter sp.]|nr:hypothetical protein [Haliscomenobacter sp.]
MEDWEARIEQAGMELLLDRPFLGRLFVQFPKTADPACPDLCLREESSPAGRFYIRPEWVISQPMPQLIFLLQRELYFWIMGHGPMERLCADFSCFVWASERALDALQGQPAGGLFPFSQAANALGSKDSLPWAGDVAAFYRACEAPEFPRDTLSALDSQVVARYVFRKGGSESGPSQEAMVADRKAWLLHQVVRSGSPGEVEGLPEAVQDYLERIPGALSGGPDWRRILNRFVLGRQGSRLRPTWRRPSQRFGTFPGIRVAPGKSLYVVADTSASVDSLMLSRFWAEIGRIHALGIRIVVAECDTRVRARYLFSGKRPPVWAGRGGTLYDEPIQLGNDVWHPGLMVYFTDGEGPAPLEAPRFPMLWVIAGERRPLELPGQLTWMKDIEQRIN